MSAPLALKRSREEKEGRGNWNSQGIRVIADDLGYNLKAMISYIEEEKMLTMPKTDIQREIS